LIPGFWLDGLSWNEVVPALDQARHRTHALTLPGMESQDADRSEITLRDHIDAVVEVIDSVDLAEGKVVLVGLSGGGAIAHAAVDVRPDRVACVVYVDSGPLDEGGVINDELRAAFRERAIPSPGHVARDPQQLPTSDATTCPRSSRKRSS
jgi:pimeloyl-ACP methyl ester carboxylesterase